MSCYYACGLLLSASIAATLFCDTGAGAEKPRVLILGDSVSIGYTPRVQEMLKDEAVVKRPMRGAEQAENCAGTSNGVARIDAWLADDGGKWDVIHFNFGLHDLKSIDPVTGAGSTNPDHPRQADPETYRRQLTTIVKKLKATDARLIFATTTPVPTGGVKPYRNPEDPARYNAIAREIMQANGVAINDLYGFAEPRLGEIQIPVNVHFTPPGSRRLAEQVAAAIRAALNDAE